MLAWFGDRSASRCCAAPPGGTDRPLRKQRSVRGRACAEVQFSKGGHREFCRPPPTVTVSHIEEIITKQQLRFANKFPQPLLAASRFARFLSGAIVSRRYADCALSSLRRLTDGFTPRRCDGNQYGQTQDLPERNLIDWPAAIRRNFAEVRSTSR
jgi:hypothetical protein